MLYHLPGTFLGLIKLYRGKNAGQDKLSDLVRATVTVDET